MRFFLRLPLCPYCEERFLYPDVRRSRNLKIRVCPHCGRKFRVSKIPGRAVLFTASALILVGIDRWMLQISSMNLFYLALVTAAGVIITRLLIPYTVRYQPF